MRLTKCECGKKYFVDTEGPGLFPGKCMACMGSCVKPTPTAKLISLNDLANECGYFGTGTLFFDAHVPNDGYICNHPAQEETEAGFGLCHRWSCPLARQATMADLRELDADLYRQYADEFPADDDVPSGGEDWMVRG